MDSLSQHQEKLRLLEEKYGATGQDLGAYLEGLIHADYLKYWDYINLDTLLSLQTPLTRFPDENIFILYHQITELYFKLIRHALHQITTREEPTGADFKLQLSRMNFYWDNLIHSFDIMVNGMEKDQFLKFRMALLPASGFQSAQYRMIEIASTPALNLVSINEREKLRKESSLDVLAEHFYWKQGGIELKTGRKTLTLLQF